jgi:hypothetical protein
LRILEDDGFKFADDGGNPKSMELTVMSNSMNPFALRSAGVLVLGAVLTSCSLLPWAVSEDRPYRVAAEGVVAQVGSHTKLSSRCRAAASAIVESGISVRLARTAGELRHAALASALSGLEWEKAGCPGSAVPGLSFGTADAAKEIIRGAHKTAGLR